MANHVNTENDTVDAFAPGTPKRISPCVQERCAEPVGAVRDRQSLLGLVLYRRGSSGSWAFGGGGLINREVNQGFWPTVWRPTQSAVRRKVIIVRLRLVAECATVIE